MPVSFKIKVTTEILELSKRCGEEEIEIIGENCAITLALKDIFSEVVVTGDYIHPFGIDDCVRWDELKIPLPKIAQDFIKVFDSLAAIPNQQLRLPEFEFEISIPDEIISEINIDEVTVLNYPSLQCASN
jgi:hypothetical protein